MSNETIFFSHSSLDSSTILPIKDRVVDITAGVINIFMSSDGQSIPFGHNWVHKIEEGLNSAQIMFVFVTPKSVNSAWIYFEAGFAYSKKIEVIPVGIGVNIGQLKPPLNLLQGFDITTADSLNNFITIINRKFNFTFKETFTEADYKAVFNSVAGTPLALNLFDVFSYARYELYSEHHDFFDKTKTIHCDIDRYFYDIKVYLEQEHMHYAYQSGIILVGGLQIEISGSDDTSSRIYGEHMLAINLSMESFENSFDLLKTLFSRAGITQEWMEITLYLNGKYGCLCDQAAGSSVITHNKDVFSYVKERVGFYAYEDKFYFKLDEIIDRSGNHEYVVRIMLKIKEVSTDEFIEFINELQRCHLIFKIKDDRDND